MILGNQVITAGVRIVLRDEFSATGERIKNSLRGIQSEIRSTVQDNLRAVRQMSLVGFGMGVGAIRGMGQMVKTAADYDYTMSMAKYVTNATASEIKKLKDEALSLGTTSLFDPTKVGQSMLEFGKAGLDAKQTLDVIRPAIYLASAGMEDLQLVTIDLVTTMNAFKLPFNQTAHVADVLTKGINQSVMNLKDLGEALSYSSGSAKLLGGTLEENVAMIGALAQAGIKGSAAGVALNNLYLQLSTAIGQFATKRDIQGLSALGLSPGDIVDAKGDLLSMVEIMRNFARAIEGPAKLANTQAASAVSAITNIRAAKGLLAMTKQMKTLDTFVNNLYHSQGEAFRGYQASINNYKGSIVELENTWKSFSIAFSEAIRPILIPLLNGLKGLLNILKALSETAVGKFLAIATAGFILLGTAVTGINLALSGWKLLFSSNRVSFENMKNAMLLGYSEMAVAAQMYNQVAGGGVMGKVRYNATRGTYYRVTPTGMQGRRVRPEVAQRYARMQARSSALGMGANIAGTAGGIAMSTGNPWGWAIGGVLVATSLALSYLANKVEDNTEATKTNTSALTSKELQDLIKMDILTLTGGRTTQRYYSMQEQMYGQDIQKQVEAERMNMMQNMWIGAKNKNSSAIHIYLDGKETVTDIINDNEKKQRYKNLGISFK